MKSTAINSVHISHTKKEQRDLRNLNAKAERPKGDDRTASKRTGDKEREKKREKKASKQADKPAGKQANKENQKKSVKK